MCGGHTDWKLDEQDRDEAEERCRRVYDRIADRFERRDGDDQSEGDEGRQGDRDA